MELLARVSLKDLDFTWTCLLSSQNPSRIIAIAMATTIAIGGGRGSLILQIIYCVKPVRHISESQLGVLGWKLVH